jgi:hypothetical protein
VKRSLQIAHLFALSAAVMLGGCGGGGSDPEPTGSSGGPVAGSGTPPCPVPEVNGQCPTPATGGGSPSTPPPPPPPPPTTPPTTPPSANTDPCVIPTPGFTGTYRSSAKPDMNIRIVTSGTTLAPVETTTMTGDDSAGGTITVESRNDLKVTQTASGGPQLSWNKIRTEITAQDFNSVQEYSAGQTLKLPMLPGDSQTTGGAISGTHNLVVGFTSCSGNLSGSQVVTYTYAGIDPVTVPAGKFAACRFNVTRVSDIKTTCENGTMPNGGAGSGKATDTSTLWVLDGHIIKSVGTDGSALELMSYTQ